MEARGGPTYYENFQMSVRNVRKVPNVRSEDANTPECSFGTYKFRMSFRNVRKLPNVRSEDSKTPECPFGGREAFRLCVRKLRHLLANVRSEVFGVVSA